MLKGLRQMFSSGPAPAPYADPKESIPLGEVLKRNWLELWYQPKIDLNDVRPIGAEALVRARHPERGVVAPHLFLPGAGEADLLALTEQVLLTALRDWELLSPYGTAMKLAVNVPASALSKLDIPKILRDARPRNGRWPGLVLEVTEAQIIDNLDLAAEAAAALRPLRCTLALDNFGGAHASLAQLQQSPFDELKIDRSFVMNCHCDRFRADRCETAIALGRRFGADVVAEGIETVHESRKLRDLGCRIGQGFLFAKPMPKGQLIGLVRQAAGNQGAVIRHRDSRSGKTMAFPHS